MARSDIRSKTGCLTCRQRKKKCNEEKPICSGCRRNCLQCYWPTTESSRGSINKSIKEHTGVFWRVLHPSRDFHVEGATEGSSLPVASSQATHASGNDTQHQGITVAVSRSDAATGGQRDRSPAQHSLDLLPTFGGSGSTSSPEESRTCFPAMTTRAWEDSDRSAFHTDDGSHPASIARLEAVDGHSPAHAASIRQELSTSPPGAELANLGEQGCDISPGSQYIVLSGDEAAAGETMGTSDNSSRRSMDADNDDNMANLTACGSFSVSDTADQNPEASDTISNTAGSDSMSLSVPGRVSLFPQQDPDAFQLLSFYLSRTANSMGNGSTDSNPFLSTLIPLAFSDQLTLQLLLAQSAVHRQVGQAHASSDLVAQRYYTGSLRLFRSAIREYISGKFKDRLILTTGSLILSLTEVARGDINGNIFDHIIAAKSLLVELSADDGKVIPQDFMDFLIEYYTHMSVLSMISVNPQHCSNPLLDVTIERLARKLIEKRYVGQLCGCWLELLLTIPHIFDLGQRMRTPDRPSPDDMIMFGLLQAQITAFEPDARVSEATRLAALVFKQAVLLYLWSILGCFQQEQGDSMHSDLMSTAVTEGIALLEQIPATCRINTSLCWPLTIIGCCTTEESLRVTLRTRLQSMFSCIGLGNMGETLLLLELVWTLPLEQRSPWFLYELMQEHQRWVSFA
ncbi:hypothetical protein NLU13_3620 [Sarocladium strictum]|uniref:Zn(2)-C6 fungal-type domain-containing protein n=1 Tax=Sarocladium strictum TaxID=5046 RepID=A0AA39LAF0_SARSR|nr:hypothetical protein NLU13_3620 [Sarocladium strictum]